MSVIQYVNEKRATRINHGSILTRQLVALQAFSLYRLDGCTAMTTSIFKYLIRLLFFLENS